MPGPTPLKWLFYGFSVATLAAALLQSEPAHAQAAEDEASTFKAQDASSAGAAGTSSRNVGNGPAVDDDNAAPDVASPIPDGDPSQDPAEADPDDQTQPRQGQRPAVKDGDLSTLPDSNLERDGVIDVTEPLPPEDGADTTAIDMREQEEIDLFENPPAGYDPLLFQIEDVDDPISTDRRPARLFAFEPYDPVGIKLGSFVYFPMMEVGGGVISNVLRSPQASTDVAAELRTESRLVSNWATHAVELRTTSFTSFHDDFPSEDDRSWGVEGRGRLDVTKRTNIQALASHNFAREGRSAIDASTTGDRDEVTSDVGALALNHRFNRLSVQLRGTATEADYEKPDALIQAENLERDNLRTEEAVRATWEFKPSFSVFGEIEGDQRDFEIATLSDKISRDSKGERYRAGIDFGTTGQVLRGEASVGYGIQTPDDHRLEPVEGVLFDSNVAWRFNELTSFQLLAGTEIYDTTTEKSAGVLARYIGIEARHAFRQYLIGTAGITWQNQDYASNPLREDEWRTALGLEYYVNREFILFGRYQHTDFESTAENSNYHVDEAHVGLRVRR